MKHTITITMQTQVEEILGSIAWRHLAIADIENLDDDPVDAHRRVKIRQALVEAFLTGMAWAENRKENK